MHCELWEKRKQLDFKYTISVASLYARVQLFSSVLPSIRRTKVKKYTCQAHNKWVLPRANLFLVRKKNLTSYKTVWCRIWNYSTSNNVTSKNIEEKESLQYLPIIRESSARKLYRTIVKMRESVTNVVDRSFVFRIKDEKKKMKKLKKMKFDLERNKYIARRSSGGFAFRVRPTVSTKCVETRCVPALHSSQPLSFNSTLSLSLSLSHSLGRSLLEYSNPTRARSYAFQSAYLQSALRPQFCVWTYTYTAIIRFFNFFIYSFFVTRDFEK